MTTRRERELGDEVTMGIVRHSVAEETQVYPRVEAEVDRDEAIAPTRAHPLTPNEAAVRTVLGPVASLLDHLRDAVSGRGRPSRGRCSSPRTGLPSTSDVIEGEDRPVEPVSLLIGAALLAVGYGAGLLTRRRPVPPPPPAPALCGCGHTLSQHDTETNTCYAELRRDTYDKRGRWSGHAWVPCTCRQYVGPRPIDEVFLPRLLPPAE